MAVREFVRVEPEGNHNAFFRMTVGDRLIETESGWIAPDEVKAVPGRKFPLSAMDLLVKKMLAKGYVERAVSPKSVERKPIADPEIRGLVSFLMERSMHELAEAFAFRPCDVTEADIREARRLIGLISAASDADGANRLLRSLYVTLPRKMRDVAGMMASSAVDIPKILERETDLVSMLETQVAAGKGNGTVLDALGLHMRLATKEEARRVIAQMDMGSSRMSRYRVSRIFRVTGDRPHAAHEAWRKGHGVAEERFLFHGTRTGNVMSLAACGFAAKSQSAAPRAGSMFGSADDGVFYLAPRASKSVGYTDLDGAYWTKGAARVGYLFLMRVAYRNPLHLYSEVRGQGSFTAASIAPHDAVHAHAAAGWLFNDEVVIYSAAQAEPCYLIEIALV